MGNRKRIIAFKVTNSPIVSPEVLSLSNPDRPLKAVERNKIKAMKRLQKSRSNSLELANEQATKRQRLMKAAISVTERNQKSVSFMGKREISTIEARLNGNVKLIADKDGIHFSNNKPKKVSNDAIVTKGTESLPFTFRDLSGNYIGTSKVATNKVW